MSSSKNNISPASFMNPVLQRNGKLGIDACEIMHAAVKAVDPYQSVKANISLYEDKFVLGGKTYLLDDYQRMFVLGFGKASVPMAKSLIDLFGERIIDAKVITKDQKFLAENGYQDKLEIFLGGHPIPTADSIQASQFILDGLPNLSRNDLVWVVVSGGGSALFTKPINTVSLEALQQTTDLLLRSGADIQDINTIRKHLDQVKGGRLAQRLQPAAVQTLILSDVIGDQLDMIASGPTVPDPTDYSDALAVIRTYDLQEQIPDSIMKSIEKGANGQLSETMKPGDPCLETVENHLVGTNIKAAMSARNVAEDLGYQSLILSSHLTGKTGDVADFLDGIIQTEMKYQLPLERPVCLIFGGETTVTVKGDGLGGRNQDLALKMVSCLADYPQTLFISLATDGEDGPTDAAGAAVDHMVFRDATGKLGLKINAYIEKNDSYHFFKRVGGLIRTGSTGTNVNDLIIILMGDFPKN